MNGTDYIYDHGYDGSSDVGYNVSAPGTVYEGSTGSEMAYMFYNNLGNLAYYYELNGNDRPDGTWGLQNVSFESGGPGGLVVSFQNSDKPPGVYNIYYSGTEYAPEATSAWWFGFGGGGQGGHDFSSSCYTWAVRDGDSVPIPEPSTLLLLGSASLFGAAFRKKSRRQG